MVLAASLFLAVSAIGGQVEDTLMQRDELFAASDGWLEGYVESISGEQLDYPRLRPDRPVALLTRATTGEMAIEWKTEAVPAAVPEEGVVFFWMAGMDLQGHGQRFDVFVNGEPRFQFASGKDGEWGVDGVEGGRLEFSAFTRDQHGDGFGYIRLFAPRAWVEPGESVVLRVVGEEAGVGTWFMTYECPDALAHFRAESEHQGWLDLAMSSDTELGTQVEVSAPQRWAGKAIDLSFGRTWQSPTQLVAGERGARAVWSIPRQIEAFIGAPLRVQLDGKPLIENAKVFAEIDTAYIAAKRIVRIGAEAAEKGQWTVRVRMDHQPELAANLIALSDSPLASGEIHIVSSSHQDIAWMDSPQQCIEDRDVHIITPALEELRVNPDYHFCMENVLCLREYLERHPELREEIAEFTRKGRITWGGTYNAPYEEMYSGEALVRQFYLGRRWLRETLPGCDGITYWNVDVPGRTLQMPQLMAKAGVPYGMISRHQEGFFRWLAPDGSAAWFWSSGHYGNSFPHLAKEFFGAAGHVAAEGAQWSTLPRVEDEPAVVPILSDWDMGKPVVYEELVERWSGLDTMLQEDGTWRRLTLPELRHASSVETMSAMAAAYADAPSITGERPAVWLYIHGPSHQKALTAAREGSRLLCEAETFSTVRSLLEGSFESYPQARLTEGWEAAIYPDHGWGGKNGEITDALFLEKFEFARDLGHELRGDAMEAIAARVKTDPEKGTSVVVFNPLSWARSGLVVVEIEKLSDGEEFDKLRSASGEEIDFFLLAAPGSDPPRFRLQFYAPDVPPVGYATFYLGGSDDRERFLADRGEVEYIHVDRGFETDHYRIRLGRGGIEELYDKELGVDVLDTGRWSGGEIFTLRSEGHGAGEFADVQQPTLEGFNRLGEWQARGGSPPGPPPLASGPAGRTVRHQAKFEHAEVILDLTFYWHVKRIDFDVQLLGFDGTEYREFRLALPLAMEDSQVAYEVPFGVVEVGKDEIPGAAGERYTTPCAEVHPRGIGNWISASNDKFGVTLSSSVAVADWIDVRDPDSKKPVLQPVLLASRQSCHGEGPLYAQPGDHSFHFSLTSHAPGWRNGDRFGKEANAPLHAVLAIQRADADLPESHSFVTVQPENVLLSTLKRAEDGEGVIARIFDGYGVDSTATIELPGDWKQALSTNLIEDDQRPLPLQEGAVKLELGHHAIETVRLK